MTKRLRDANFDSITATVHGEVATLTGVVLIAVDEDVVPVPPPTCGLDVGLCEPGTLACVNGNFQCQGGTGPVRDGCSATDNQCICDTFDNDCDNATDEGALPCYGFPTGCDVATGVCQGT